MTQLDSRIRLCIRDSLFRLAKTAAKRNYTSDTSSMISQTKTDEHSNVDVAKEVQINAEKKYVISIA